MHIGTVRHSLTITPILTAFADCGGSAEKSKPQVAARVNGEEIAVHQPNRVLSMMEPEAVVHPAEANESAPENIINQTVGVRVAFKMKPDRDSANLQAIV